MVLQKLKSFGLIALITVLIWLLAESESLRSDKVSVRLTFRADPESGRMIRVDPGQDFNGSVSVRLEGSTAKVEAVAAALRREQVLEPGSPGIPSEPAQHTAVQLQTVLAGLPAFRDAGVVVTEVDPPTVSVSVDRLATRDCPVRVELPPGQAVDGAPEITPPTVQLRYSTSLAPPPDLTLVAHVDAAALAGLPEGQRTSIPGVTVEIPESLRKPEGAARVVPAQVSVSLTLRSRTGLVTLAAVPVYIRLAPAELGAWDIQMAPESRALTDVAVSGPADLIDQLRSERLKPVAYVALSFDDLERAVAGGGTLEKDAAFCDLPTTLRFEPKQKTVRLSVKRRETGPPTPTDH
jgi:hypothetical protein